MRLAIRAALVNDRLCQGARLFFNPLIPPLSPFCQLFEVISSKCFTDYFFTEQTYSVADTRLDPGNREIGKIGPPQSRLEEVKCFHSEDTEKEPFILPVGGAGGIGETPQWRDLLAEPEVGAGFFQAAVWEL